MWLTEEIEEGVRLAGDNAWPAVMGICKALRQNVYEGEEHTWYLAIPVLAST
jgi:hypothetical protein